jgi:hypothetical protein
MRAEGIYNIFELRADLRHHVAFIAALPGQEEGRRASPSSLSGACRTACPARRPGKLRGISNPDSSSHIRPPRMPFDASAPAVGAKESLSFEEWTND